MGWVFEYAQLGYRKISNGILGCERKKTKKTNAQTDMTIEGFEILVRTDFDW